MSAQTRRRIPWYRDVNRLGAAYNEASGLRSPVLHGAAGGAVGFLGGKLLQPALDYLYPGFDFDSKWLPLATGLLGAGAGYGLSRLAYPNGGIPKPASWTKAAANMLRGGTIDPKLLPRSLATLTHGGALSPGGAVALQSMASAASGGRQTTPGGLASTAGAVAKAVGSYLNPVNRLGWALAGMGASALTRGTGIESGIQNRLGMPTGEAVRRYGPAASLIGAGMRIAGF